MKTSWLSLFQQSSNPSAELRFVGMEKGDEVWDGKIIADGEEIGTVCQGVASFVEPGYNWSAESIQRLKESQQITHSWDNSIRHAEQMPLIGAFCEELSTVEGVILEVAAGPGGGNTPAVLVRNPEAQIILNDISHDVLQLWWEFLTEKGDGQNVYPVAFDAREPLLREEGIAMVSNKAGFGNVIDGDRALQEVYRSLMPGGCLFSFELIVNAEKWVKIPEEPRVEWEKNSPLLLGCMSSIRKAGFTIERHEITPGRPFVPEEDGIAQFAEKHGVILHARFEYIKARK